MIEHFCRLMMLGRATNDPTRRTRGRATVVAFGFVFNDRYKNGEKWVDCPMFIDCEAFHDLAEHVYDAVRRGYLILIEGKLRRDEWEDADKRRHVKHKVILTDVKVIEKPKAARPQPAPAATGSAHSQPTTVTAEPRPEAAEPPGSLFAETPAEPPEPEPI